VFVGTEFSSDITPLHRDYEIILSSSVSCGSSKNCQIVDWIVLPYLVDLNSVHNCPTTKQFGRCRPPFCCPTCCPVPLEKETFYYRIETLSKRIVNPQKHFLGMYMIR